MVVGLQQWARRQHKKSAGGTLLQEVSCILQMHWHDFWWRRVTSFWSALVEADAGSLHSMIFQDANQLALARCKLSWAAPVFKCFSALGEPLPLVADAPIASDINLLQELSLRDRLASFDSLPQDPKLAPSAGVNVCTCPAGAPPKCSSPVLLGVTNGKCQIAPDSQVSHRVSSPPS